MLSTSAHARMRAPRVAVLVTATCFTLTSAHASAAKGGKGGGSSSASALALSSEQVYNSNPLAPTWCLNEDDAHSRTWTGGLGGSFSITEQLCDRNTDYANGMYWSAGGEGLLAELWVVGSLSDLAITSPTGTAHHALLVGSTTSRGVTTDHYQVCYVPGYARSSNTSGSPLPGGTWTISLSGSFSSATYKVTGTMADVTYQQQYCPPSQQNIV
jgi:hypothetical protein